MGWDGDGGEGRGGGCIDGGVDSIGIASYRATVEDEEDGLRMGDAVGGDEMESRSMTGSERKGSVKWKVKEQAGAVETPFSEPKTRRRGPGRIRRFEDGGTFGSPDVGQDHEKKTGSEGSQALEAVRGLAGLVRRGRQSLSSRLRSSMDDRASDDRGNYEPPKYQRDVEMGMSSLRSGIPLVDMGPHIPGYDGAGYGDEAEGLYEGKHQSNVRRNTLVKPRSRRFSPFDWNLEGLESIVESKTETPPSRDHEDSSQYRGGLLSSLLRMYHHGMDTVPSPSRRNTYDMEENSRTPVSRETSGGTTPQIKDANWFEHKNLSKDSVVRAKLVEASNRLAGINKSPADKLARYRFGKKRTSSKAELRQQYYEEEINFANETVARQEYLVRLVRALMAYGAPTYRLEECMWASAEKLEVGSDFLYIPGCMIISFEDPDTHTTDIKMVKCPQGIDLGKLMEVHEIYKEVMHELLTVQEATERINSIILRNPLYVKWQRLVLYAIASATVAGYAFGAGWIDLLPCCIIGGLTGFLQLWVAPNSPFFYSIFEFASGAITSFLARFLGSVPRSSPLFCFSAIAQSSVAYILPGWLILSGALELQARSITAGAVRLVYALSYTLFLAFGTLTGLTIYGIIDPNATTTLTCAHPIDGPVRHILTLIFATSLSLLNGAKYYQLPIMLLIALTGHLVSYYTSRTALFTAQTSTASAAFAMGLLANVYSRLGRGLAVTALMPGIFMLVPGGIAASGEVMIGISGANGGGNIGGDGRTYQDKAGEVLLGVGFGMVQIAVGMAVGLWASALVVYPRGKRTGAGGLFSF